MSKPKPCKFCGTPLIWTKAHSRPLEARPAPFCRGVTGFLIKRVPSGLQWVPSSYVIPEPTEHLAVHECRDWRLNVEPISERDISDALSGRSR